MNRGTRLRRYVFINRYYEPDESATSQMLTDLARGLAARGFCVHVVCSQQLYTDAGAKLPPNESRSGVVVHRVATTRFGRDRLLGRVIDYASFYISASWTLFGLLRRGDVLIAKTDPPLISIPAAFISRLKGIALINWQQDVFPEIASQLGANPLPRWLDLYLRRIRDASLHGAIMNVVVGAKMLEYFRGRGIADSQLCVIENWADAATVTPKTISQSALRARIGLTDEFVVCYSGNLGRAHEFDTLLGAAEALSADLSIVFLMIGGGAKMEALKRAATQRNLVNFRFLPYQSRETLPDSLAAANLHLVSLLPHLEGLVMPSKLYGILAAGRPLIFIGDADGEIARHICAAECGVVVSVNASKDLVVAIVRLQSEREICASMGGRARSSFLTRHTLEHAVERWVAVLPPFINATDWEIEPKPE